VALLGSRPPAEVLRAMQEADVLAMPCVVARDGDRDSMPVVVKEAMAMGLLVVASDEVGLPECVLAPWGFLAPAGDALALAQALGAALELSPQERLAAGEAARAWVREHADVDRETAAMAAVIEASLSARAG
jgi:glycosyltransferase involved in cell wall biosynthesis